MVKILYVICILLNVVSLALIPLNLFLFDIPEEIGVLISIFLSEAILYLWMRVQSRISGKIIITVLSGIVIVVVILGSYCNPYWNSIGIRKHGGVITKDYDHVLTYEQAMEDFDYAIKYVKKVHPACIHGLPDELNERCENVKEELKKYKTIDVGTLDRMIESVLSGLFDAHTYVKALYANTHYLKYIEEHNQKNDRLVQINGISLYGLFLKNSDLYSYETESYAMINLQYDVKTLEGLVYLGIPVNEPITYTYETEGGTLQKQTYTKEDFVTYDEYAVYNHLKDSQSKESQSFVSYEIDEERSLAILTLNSCEYNEEYKACLKELFTKVKELGIKNVAVDLRYNGGGYSTVAIEFLRYIDVDSYRQWADTHRLGWFMIKNKAYDIKNDKVKNLTFGGNLYVLTTAETFSAAMNFAEYIKDNHIGTIIGQASSNSPTGCGHIARFKLPNSQLYLQIATKKWKRIDEDCKDLLVEPDIQCKPYEIMDKLYENVDVKN